MNILVYKPGLDDGSQNELPNIGMGILAASIKQYDPSVTLHVIDRHFNPHAKASIDITTMDMVCLSLVSQEWLLDKTQLMIQFFNTLGIPVVIGGPHAFSYWDILEKDPRITKVVVGEVDGQWNKVVESKEKVVKLLHPETLMTPDFSDFCGITDMKAYPLYTSRGCVAKCSFCVGSAFHGKFRTRNLDDSLMEIRTMATNYPNVSKIYVVDDCFTGDLLHAQFFLTKFNMDHWNTKYELQIINVRADQVTGDILYQMKAAGCSMLPIGVESADPHVFSHVGKGESLADIKSAIRMIQNAGITPWLNMIVGLPHDNPDAHRRSVDWCLQIPKPRIVHFFQMAPFRRTRAYNHFLKVGAFDDGYIPRPYGRRYDDLPWESDFGTDWFSAEERMVAQLDGYLRCHSPILVNNIKRVKSLCRQYDMLDLYDEWEQSSNIREYVEKELPKKKGKGQVK